MLKLRGGRFIFIDLIMRASAHNANCVEHENVHQVLPIVSERRHGVDSQAVKAGKFGFGFYCKPKISSCLSDHLLLRFGLGPRRWCEPLDLGDLGRWQPRKQVPQIPGAIASLTEWWRLSTVGFSIGLMICGFGFPLVSASKIFVLV